MSVLARVRAGLNLLAYKEFVTTYPMTSKAYTRGVNLWQLSRAGELYYHMLTDGATALSAENPEAELQIKHSFGINQVVTALVGAGATASRLGLIEQIVRQVVKLQPSLNMDTPQANSGPSPASQVIQLKAKGKVKVKVN